MEDEENDQEDETPIILSEKEIKDEKKEKKKKKMKKMKKKKRKKRRKRVVDCQIPNKVSLASHNHGGFTIAREKYLVKGKR